MKQIKAFVGCFFIAVSAFLYATKHITAAIISSNINRPDVNYYEGAYKLVGFGINFWIFISLLVGVVMIISLLTQEVSFPFKKKQTIEENPHP
ncbi:hypothetical protein DZB84_17090 [Bacillus sp. HNG]|uniref:hypothetical protein n=1 Tax=Bacillus sp. HNG TaxID=2293325 RepID=UPI000E2F778B|nr:hypothetical protein [Bacillus sp. HNG]RFB13346.1 hypothetical protein DZB84_17090 [Bacillus sp. HNG]